MFEDFRPYLTPYRLGRPVLAGSGVPGRFDARGVDVPFVFYHNGRFMMMYTGFDGTGYQTALAQSDNLTDWRTLGVILPRKSDGSWDAVGASGTWMLKADDSISALPTLQKYNGRYWMIYHSYPSAGYEEGPAEIGLAWCEDEDLMLWTRLEQPVLSWRGGADWERGGLYKGCFVRDGGFFRLFYNAKTEGENWIEQTGMCVSEDMIHWTRCAQNPILPVTPGGWDSRFASDPCMLRDGKRWLMFYYGYDGRHAQDGLTVSEDLTRWEKAAQPLLTYGAPGSLDSIHAHKPAILTANGRLYHFYCACREHRPDDAAELWNEFRTITVASSEPFDADEKERL